MVYKPAVFAVENEYQILVPVNTPSLMWVRVGDRCYYDDCNGVLRSATEMHRMCVPAEALDAAGAYTICERQIPHRKAYCSRPKPVVETTFVFRPVPCKGEVRAYMIADSHDRVSEAVRAAQTFGSIDFLIFNGDIADYSNDLKLVLRVFEIADVLAGGEIPLVFSRGNHDMRGALAERLTDFTPHAAGRSYYSFRLGRIWGLVLDCGEDKVDGHVEYGGTICCHDFRERETAYLERLCDLAPYDAPGIDTRIVVAHNPFSFRINPPFDIEEATYTRWCALLREQMHPDLMLAGHLHALWLCEPGGEKDNYGQPCPVLVGSKNGKDYFVGSGLVFRDDGIHIDFTDSDGKCLGTQFAPKADSAGTD